MIRKHISKYRIFYHSSLKMTISISVLFLSPHTITLIFTHLSLSTYTHITNLNNMRANTHPNQILVIIPQPTGYSVSTIITTNWKWFALQIHECTRPFHGIPYKRNSNSPRSVVTIKWSKSVNIMFIFIALQHKRWRYVGLLVLQPVLR